MNEELINAATALSKTLLSQGLTVTTAESCTSGWVGSSLAAVADSSRFYSSGFITYSDRAKQRLLGVSSETLRSYTAVSEQVVREMSEGGKQRAGDDIGIAVSGYAGPDGGEDGTPPGTVWFAWHLPGNQVHTACRQFAGSSEAVVHQATLFCLEELRRILGDNVVAVTAKSSDRLRN
ncbi:CinA family protein [Pantoea sp.]|uniref:CinA family protein n=1 Tax=Pantoea sp. TaxID=69393 RepID=UPI0028AA907D|nr:CinA family protein [Pantoea sp.]